jgi:hypothetical protein
MKYEIITYEVGTTLDFTLGIFFNGEWLHHEEIDRFFEFLNTDITYHDIVTANNGYREHDEICDYYWFKSEKDCINAYRMMIKLI